MGRIAKSKPVAEYIAACNVYQCYCVKGSAYRLAYMLKMVAVHV